MSSLEGGKYIMNRLAKYHKHSFWQKPSQSGLFAKRSTRAIALILAALLVAGISSTAERMPSGIETGVLAISSSRMLAAATSSDQPIGKNETVYGILKNDGSVDSVEIVNHVYLRTDTVGSLSWQDYGSYSDLVNLLDDRQPETAPLSADQIKKAAAETGLALSDYDDMRSLSWDGLDSSNWQDLYYQGTSSSELPWTISLSWKLNGAETSAEALAGASGRVELSIDIEPAGNADDVYLDSFMLQISVPLALNKTREVDASGASSMIAGRTRTLAYTVLPGQSGSFKLSFTADDFSMDPVQITALPANIDLQGFESLTEGVSEISQGQNQLADGTKQLGSGMSELLFGLEELSSGLADYSAGGNELQRAMETYSGGLTELKTQMANLAAGGGAFAGGLDQYALSGQQVLQGYAQLAQQLPQMRLPAETLAELNQLLSLPDQLPDGTDLTAQKELAQSLLALDGSIGGIEQGLQQLNSGLGDYIDGATSLSDQFGQIYSGMAALEPAAGELADGFGQISGGFRQRELGLPMITDGISQISTDGEQLPAVADELSEGQKELAAGLESLEQAVSALMEYKEPVLVSFAAPGLVKPDSVQFLLRTQGIG